MTDKGTCQLHGEFDLREGCSGCLAERVVKEGITKSLADDPTLYFRHDSSPVIHVDDNAVATKALIKIAPEEDLAIEALVVEAEKALEFAKARVITSVEDVKLATDDLTLIAGLKKALMDKQTEYTKPINTYKDAILATFKMMLTPIVEADRITKEKMLVYNREQQRIRQEQEEINQLKMEAAQKEKALNGESEPVDLVEVSPEAPKTVSTDMGSAGMTDHWKYEVLNFSMLPDEYKLPDTAMLNSIAKRYHDQKQIPGVRFYNEPYIAVRSK